MRAFRVDVPAEEEDAATLRLWEAGTSGMELRSERPGVVTLVAYFDDEAAPPLLPWPTAPVPVPDVDWVARFREGFRAFRAGAFHIRPVWENATPSRHVLVVDPGQAFGTGTHETTRLCLRALEDLADRRPLGRVMDLGAGTGILAIAALHLGARAAIASDIDPEASLSARSHARLNGVRLPAVTADGARAFRARAFDVVLANLMAPLLIERRDEIAALLTGSGTLVLSGLLTSDVPDVRAAFDVRSGSPRILEDGEWAALVYEGPP